MNIKTFSGCLAVMAAGLYSCSKPADDTPVLVVSIEPQRYILEQLVGDYFKVTTLMPGGDNPEIFEPTLDMRRDIEKSAAYFTIGSLPFEKDLALSAPDDVRIIETAVGITPIFGTHDHHHNEFLGEEVDSADTSDPHFWTSVRNMRQISRTMTTTLETIDPDNAEEYNSRYRRLDAHLDSLDKAFAARLAPVASRPFLVWHPSLSYFSRDYGLEQIAVSPDNKELAINALKEVIDNAREENVSTFFYQRVSDTRQVESINRSLNSKMVPFNPVSYEWEQELNNVVDALTGN